MPTEVFIREVHSKRKEKDREEIDTDGLIDFVDFGPDANAFLRSVGVLPFPTAPILAELLLDRQEDYLTITRDSGKGINERLKVYLHCLKQLAMLHSAHQDLMTHPIRTRLKNERWCLGYRTVDKDNSQTECIGQVVRPSEVYLNDDHSMIADLQPVCAPDEQLIIELYRALGSRWLSESAQRIIVHTGNRIDSSFSFSSIITRVFRRNKCVRASM